MQWITTSTNKFMQGEGKTPLKNADIFDDFWQSRTPTYRTYFKQGFDKKRENCGALAGSNAVTCGYKTIRGTLPYPRFARAFARQGTPWTTISNSKIVIVGMFWRQQKIRSKNASD